MLWLTGAIGQEVLAADGTEVGRVLDLSVRLDPDRPTPVVSRLVVGVARRRCVLVDHARVAAFTPDRIELREGFGPTPIAVDTISEHLLPDELLLGRDVLDTQIVDVVGHRLARVADVALVRTTEGALEVLAVEIGFARVLERLGLHRLARHRPDASIAWTDLHLTSDRGHLVQLASPASAVHRLTDGDLAALVARLDLDAATEVLAHAGATRSAGAIGHAHPSVAERLLRAMPEADRSAVLAQMPAEHAHRWRRRLAHVHPLRGRRLLRGSDRHHRHDVAAGGWDRPTEAGDR